MDATEEATNIEDVPSLTELLDDDPSVCQTVFRRGTLPSALSHKLTKCSRDMWRTSALMDDFDIAVVDQPSRKRVKFTRQCLKDIGSEVKFPFGDEKWAEGEPSQDMLVYLGIGFDVKDPLQPCVYIPEAGVTEVVYLYLMRRYVEQDKLLLSEAQSSASKLIRMTMVVESGRLYVCGLFALSRLVGGGGGGGGGRGR
jgi:hypothetical protein